MTVAKCLSSDSEAQNPSVIYGIGFVSIGDYHVLSEEFNSVTFDIDGV